METNRQMKGVRITHFVLVDMGPWVTQATDEGWTTDYTDDTDEETSLPLLSVISVLSVVKKIEASEPRKTRRRQGYAGGTANYAKGSPEAYDRRSRRLTQISGRGESRRESEPQRHKYTKKREGCRPFVTWWWTG